MVTKAGRQRVRKFITAAQSHLQWLRMEKWRLEQAAKKVESSMATYNSHYYTVCSRIEEVSRDIESVFKLLH